MAFKHNIVRIMSSVSSVGRKPPPPPKPKNLSQEFARALFDYTAEDPEELSFKEGDILYVVDKVADQEWWKVIASNII